MQANNAPTKIYTPFAVSGTKNSIPIPSQISTTPGKASYTDGFPPLTLTPVASGGVPPFGADFNGILNAITQIQQWQSGGGMFSYDATWNSDNSGYPKGAMLLKGAGIGYWMNTVDANANDPDTGGTGWLDISGGVVGTARNLRASLATAGTSLTITADEIVVASGLGGTSARLASFNKTLNVATTGAGGMDTGSAPASGYVAIYVIYNPSASTAALLGVNATSAAAANIYGGANMPSGYTLSALISVWPTNASSQLKEGIQQDRSISFTAATALSTSTSAAALTSLSVSGIIPFNAKRISGVLQSSNTSTTSQSTTLSAAANANGDGLISCIFAGGTAGGGGVSTPYSGLPVETAQTIYYQATATTGTATYVIQISGYTI